MQPIFRSSRHICWGNHHSRSLKIPSFGGETMQPTNVAIHNSTFSLRFTAVWKRILRRCFFILANGQNFKWCQIGTVGRTEESLIAEWCEQCVVGQCRARAVLMVTASNVSMPFFEEKELQFTLLRLSTIQYRRHCSNDAKQERFFSVIVNKLTIW